MKITEGVYRLDGASNNIAHSNVYLITTGNGLMLIDTGTPGNENKILDEVKGLGHRPEDIKIIVLTHYHMDHIGSARALKDLTKAKIAAHKDDSDIISGRAPMTMPKVERSGPSPTPSHVDVDIVLDDGDTISDLVVFHLPGHTKGSIMLLDQVRKVIFTGDTLQYDGETLRAAPEQYSMDMGQLRRSIQKAYKLEFDLLLPGHGVPLSQDPKGHIQNLINGA